MSLNTLADATLADVPAGTYDPITTGLASADQETGEAFRSRALYGESCEDSVTRAAVNATWHLIRTLRIMGVDIDAAIAERTRRMADLTAKMAAEKVGR